MTPESVMTIGQQAVGITIMVSAPLLLAALVEIPREPDFGGTSFDTAFKLARLQFAAQPRPADPAERRNFSVILLSDGKPTAPWMSSS